MRYNATPLLYCRMANGSGVLLTTTFMLMRRLFVFLLFSISLSFSSCHTKTPLFELYREVNFSFPAGLDQYLTHHIIIRDIPSNLKARLSERGLEIADIKEFYAGRGKIISVFNEADFGIIDKISIWIFKKGEYDNAKEIYYRDEVPYHLPGEIKLLSTGEDVRDILMNDKYNMDIEVKFRNYLTETIDCRFPFSFVAYSE